MSSCSENALWTDTPAAPGGSYNLPNGKYTMRVLGISITQSGESQRRCFLWRLEIEGPKYQGSIFWHRDFLDNSNTILYAKRNLALLDVVLDSPDDLSQHRSSIVGKVFQVGVKWSGDYQS